MRIVSYPLPPLFLGEILERGISDHRHVCDEWCKEDSGTDYCGAACCVRSKSDNEKLLDVATIVSIVEGHGRHVHDDPDDENGCGWQDRWDSVNDREYRARRTGVGCMSDCDDSDWIVEVCYSTNGWRAVYGVKRAGDVQDVSLWCD